MVLYSFSVNKCEIRSNISDESKEKYPLHDIIFSLRK